MTAHTAILMIKAMILLDLVCAGIGAYQAPKWHLGLDRFEAFCLGGILGLAGMTLLAIVVGLGYFMLRVW